MEDKYLLPLLFAVVMLDGPGCVRAHGYLQTPPGRSSAWRFGFDTPPNYTDNQLFCGGTRYQWDKFDGKCGVCGDPFGATVKPNEDIGGKYVKNVIVGTYAEGDIITATVKLTASHLGWFEFRLCPLEYVGAKVTQTCLDEHLLTIASGPDAGKTRHNVGSLSGDHVIDLQLPMGLTCEQCVLQWWYKTGNSWGCGRDDCCRGCGPQETFVNCADIKIESSVENELPHAGNDGNPMNPSTDTSTDWLDEFQGTDDDNEDYDETDWLDDYLASDYDDLDNYETDLLDADGNPYPGLDDDNEDIDETDWLDIEGNQDVDETDKDWLDAEGNPYPGLDDDYHDIDETDTDWLDAGGNPYPGLEEEYDNVDTDVDWNSGPDDEPTVEETTTTTTKQATTTTTTSPKTFEGIHCGQSGLVCSGVGIWKTIQGYHQWCCNNCERGFCPAGFCKCFNI